MNQKNEMERDKVRGAKMKCQSVFGWNNESVERSFNIKVYEWVGGVVLIWWPRVGVTLRDIKIIEKKEMIQGEREEG